MKISLTIFSGSNGPMMFLTSDVSCLPNPAVGNSSTFMYSGLNDESFLNLKNTHGVALE